MEFLFLTLSYRILHRSDFPIETCSQYFYKTNSNVAVLSFLLFLFIKNRKKYQGVPHYCQHFAAMSHESLGLTHKRAKGTDRRTDGNRRHKKRTENPTVLVVDIQEISRRFVALYMRGGPSFLPFNFSF